MDYKTRPNNIEWLELAPNDPRWEVGHCSASTEFAAFLAQFHWNLIAHLTFKYDTSEERAKRYFNEWIIQLNEISLGRRWHNRSKRKRLVYWLRSTELQRRGVTHFHAVVGNYTGSLVLAARAWNSESRNAEIMAYSSDQLEYVIKTVNDGRCAIDYSDNLTAPNPSVQL